MKGYRLLVIALTLALLLASLPAHAMSPDRQRPSPENRSSSSLTCAEIPLQARLKIDPDLLKQLLNAKQDTLSQSRYEPPSRTTFLVYLHEQAPLSDLMALPNRQERRERLVERLQRTAHSSQAGLVSYLDQQLQKGAISRYQSYWVFNGLAVDGDLETAIQLALRPEVESIRPNRLHRLPAPEAKVMPQADSEVAWGIAQIRADRVWQEYSITGAGIVVANIDSGVDWTHPALQRKYRGYNPANPSASVHDYNWIDFTRTYTNAPGPNRGHISNVSDHGTHTMGTMVGSDVEGQNLIGVAPGAKWIAVKAFDDRGNATDENLHAAFQWCLAPTDLQGNNPDPRKAPDVINNSWGDDNGADETFRRDVIAMRAAGIFCTFSAGNAGPDSGTVGSPASLPEAFAVGATDARDSIASFSARGPSPWGEIKPDVSAPGVDIRSSIAGGTYEGGWNGTSMAAPHVAGLAALLLQAARISGASLDITTTEHIITNTAVDLGVSGADNTYGYGRVDAYQAVGTVIRSGTFAGRVTEKSTGMPLANVLIVMYNTATGGRASTQTAEDGSYSFAVAQGIYNVTASKFGYQESIVHNVQVLANTTTQLDFSLSPLPRGTVQGRVTRSTDGQPVPATVKLLGTPAQTTVDGQGYYTLTIPVGTYTVRATATRPGYRGSEVRDVTLIEGETKVLDLPLSPAPRILLVDADAWKATNTLAYYQGALDNLLYSYDTWAILDPPHDNPSANKLAEYELVIWSQPKTSPGYIEAWNSLAAYLDRGGRLFISGEDIGYWDHLNEAYQDYLHARYLRDDGGMASLLGIRGDILEGIALEFNTPDSARNQTAPDALVPYDTLARPIIASRSNTLFGLRADPCTYRVIYLGFGLEGTGPQAAREQLLLRAINWLAAARPAQKVSLYSPSFSLVGAIGSSIAHDVVIINEGLNSARFRLSLNAPGFPARLVNPITGQTITETPEMTPCAALPLRLLVIIPQNAIPAKTETITIRAIASSSPTVSATQTLEITALAPWNQVTNLPTPRYRLGSAAWGCALYTFGGLLNDENGTITNTVEIFDLRTQTWSRGMPKPTLAANYATAQLGTLVYLIGGWDPNSPTEFLNCVEVYDLAANRWAVAPPLPKPLAGMAAVAAGGKIYAFGGRGKDGPSKDTYLYDPQTRTWSQRAPLPMNVSYGQAVSLGSFIYLAGGWPNSADLLRYDPASDSWATLSPMHVGRQGFAMAAVDGFLYVAGGGNEWNGITSVERYDPLSDSWTELLPLRVGDRGGCTGAFLDGRLYVLGGTSIAASTIESLELKPLLGGSSFSVSAPRTKIGDTLRYTLWLQNPSPTGVRVSWKHPLPELLDYVQGSATGGAVYDPSRRELNWTGNLEASGTISFTFSAAINPLTADGTIITSTVTATAGGCTPIELVAKTQVFKPSLARSTLQVDKAEAAPGDELRYTIQLMNSSPFTVSNASLTARIPNSTTLIPGSLVGAAYNAAQNRVEWMGALPPAESAEPTFQWIDATGGQPLSLSDDSCVGPLDLGFEFEFYGRRYAAIYVNSNGMVLFESCSQAYRNEAIPSSSEPNGFIAPFWDDLTPGNGAIYMATFGRAPNRYAVIEWHNVTFYGQSERQTFEVILYEGSNSIVFQYLDINGSRGMGSSATVGIENQDGTEGIQYLFNGEPSEHALRGELALEMIQPSTNKASVHTIAYAVRVHSAPPPLTVIRNTVIISDAYATYTRTVTTTIYSPLFDRSSKTVLPPRALSGDTVTYTLRLMNSGQVTATNAFLSDTLPTGITYIPGSLRGEGATYNAAQQRIEWRGTLPPGAIQTITYQARVNAGLSTNYWITNTATISVQGVIMGALQAGLLVNEVNLAASAKAANASEIVAGTPITYTITVRNTGLAQAENVTLRDQLPAMVDLVPESLEGGIYNSEQRTVSWAGALRPGGEHMMRFRVNTSVNLLNGTLITNTAILEDGHSSPITLVATTKVLRGDLSSSDMSASPAWLIPGNVVTLTIRLRNTGSVPIAGLLRYRPPAPIEIVTGTAYTSSGVITQQGQEINWQGTVLPQAMVILRCQVTAPPGTPTQTVMNQASLTDAGGLERTLRTPIIINAHLTFFPEVRRLSQW